MNFNIPDHFSESFATFFRVKKFIDRKIQIRDPGPGINICIDRADLGRSVLIKAYLPNETIPYPGNQCWGPDPFVRNTDPAQDPSIIKQTRIFISHIL
jgi:hypothetical protein